MRRLVAVAGLLLGLFVAGVAGAAPASAHAELVSGDPADSARLDTPPGSVTLRFSEPVGLGLGYVRVVDASGSRVDTGTVEHPGGDASAVSVRLRGGLGDGSYTVSWRVVSADSHPAAGAYSFVVGDGPLVPAGDAAGAGGAADPAVGAVFDAARWAGFAGLVLLVGGAAFLVLAWPSGQDERRPLRLVWTGWGLAAGTTALGLPLEGLYASGQGFGHLLDTGLLDSTLHTNYGRMLSARLVLLAVLALLVDHVLDSRPTEDGERRWQVDAAAVVSLGVFATYAAAGHAATGIQPPLAVLSDTLHLAAMATWIGGVVMLAAALLPGRRAAELARALPLFSRIAVLCVGTLVATGLYQTWREVGTLPALWSTGYGRLLMAKVAGFLVLVGLGYLSHTAIRRRYVLPVVHALAAPAGGRRGDVPGPAAAVDGDAGSGEDGDPARRPDGGDDDAPLVARLRRSVGVEVLLAAGVLALTAVLVAQAPGRQTYATPYDRTLPLPDGGSVQVEVTPARRGGNEFHLFVFGRDGRPVEPRDVTVTAALPAEKLGPLPVRLHDAGPGHFVGSGLSLPDAGTWQVRVAVRTSEFDESSVTAKVTVR
jgi:copper transport protein